MTEPRDLFADVADITAWLDTANPRTAHEDSMRVLKLVEEAGEAAAAYIGMVGQNPPLTEQVLFLRALAARAGRPCFRWPVPLGDAEQPREPDPPR